MERPRIYSDIGIKTALTLRLLFKLPLRQTEGFLWSLIKLIHFDLTVPDHSTLSRRNTPQHGLSPRARENNGSGGLPDGAEAEGVAATVVGG